MEEVGCIFHALLVPTSENGKKMEIVIKTNEKDNAEWMQNVMGFICMPNLNSERLLAVIYVKNAIKKHWSGKSSLFKNKLWIKKCLLSRIQCEDYGAIVLQLQVCVAKIARVDWPVHWHELMECLKDMAFHDGHLNGVITLKKVLKEVASRRLMMHKKVYMENTKMYFPIYFQVWQSLGEHVASKRFYVLTKVLYFMVVYGFKCNCAEFASFLKKLHENMPTWCMMINSENIHQEDAGMIKKLVRLAIKLILETQRTHAIDFVPYLGPFLNMFHEMLVLHQSKIKDMEITRGAANFLSNVINCQSYALKNGQVVGISVSGDDKDAMAAQMGYQVVQDFFSVSRKAELMTFVATRGIQLTEKDVLHWENDTEDFLVVQESMTALESSKVACENLFLYLLQSDREHMANHFLQILQQAQILPNAMEQATSVQILTFESVLTAFGLASFDLHEYFEFEPWFMNILAPLLTSKHYHFRVPVLQRRIVWIIGCWMQQISSTHRKSLYDSLLFMMHESSSTQNSSLALQITALDTMQTALNDWEFDIEQFRQHIARTVQGVYIVFHQAEQMETRIKALTLLCRVIEVADQAILQLADSIIASLPSMWESLSAEMGVRTLILSVFSTLVHSIGPHSISMHDLLLPVLHSVTSGQNPNDLYLIETGLDTWASIMCHSTTLSPPLLAMYPNITTLLAKDTEHLKVCMNLIQSYALFQDKTFWTTHGAPTSALLATLVGTVKPEGSSQIIRTADLLVQTIPPDQLSSLSAFFQKLVHECFLYRAGKANREPSMIIIKYLSILSRLSLASPSLFTKVLFHTGQILGLPSEDAILVEYLELLIERYHNELYRCSSNLRPKMWACSLCSFLQFPSPVLLQYLPSILEITFQVIDMKDHPTQYLPSESSSDAESARRKQLTSQDPFVHCELQQYATKMVQKASQHFASIHVALEQVEVRILHRLGYQ